MEHLKFERIKVNKKVQITKNIFQFELEIPKELKEKFVFQSGEFLSVRYLFENQKYINPYSILNAPHENKIHLGIKINPFPSSSQFFNSIKEGDFLEVTPPMGKFTLNQKPDEFRTILTFAAGVGIVPILSHIKNLLYTEKKTRIFLFYGNKTQNDIAFKTEIDSLKETHADRFEVFHFLSQEENVNPLFKGRITTKKIELIINQILHLDETDEESTIWDSVDEVLICGKGEMIQNIATACFENGIPKKNIHFELFKDFNQDIFPMEKEYPLIENIKVKFQLRGKSYTTHIKNNKNKLLQELLIQQYPIPYSCKSGICGICECKIIEGEIETIENEYLTPKEEQEGKTLACMSVMMSQNIKINFD